MLRNTIVGIGGGMRLAFLPIFDRDPDSITIQTSTTEERPNEFRTGYERVVDIFRPNQYDVISPELNAIHQAGFMGLLCGGIWGGFLQSRITFMNYMENNQATVFRDHMEAKRHLNREMTLGFGRGFYRWGWRMALWSTSFVGIITIMSTYRDKSSILDYVVAGTTTGAIYKINLGLRGMVSGGFFGCLLGTVCGCCALTILKCTGHSMRDVRYFQYGWREARDKAIHATYKTEEETEVIDRTPQIKYEGDDNNLETLADGPINDEGKGIYTLRIASPPTSAKTSENK